MDGETKAATGATWWRERSFLGGVWHGALLAASTALSDVTVVLPALIDELTGSSVWVGGLAAILAVAAALPQVVVARYVEPLRRKRPVLLFAVYLRTASLAGLGFLVANATAAQPGTILAALVVMMTLFSAGGALGNVPFTDIVGRVIPARRRGAFFASRQMAGSVLSVGASALAGVLLRGPAPQSYAYLFLLASVVLGFASAGIWAFQEPDDVAPAPRQSWGAYFRSLREPARRLGGTALVLSVTGFGLLAMPFYVVAARRVAGAPPEATALFIGANVIGALLGNLAWGWLVDRYGSRRMVLVCVGFAVATPIVALLAGVVGWPLYTLVFVLVGANTGGRKVGFQSALLESAPAAQRSSYTAVYALMSLPCRARAAARRLARPGCLLRGPLPHDRPRPDPRRRRRPRLGAPPGSGRAALGH